MAMAWRLITSFPALTAGPNKHVTCSIPTRSTSTKQPTELRCLQQHGHGLHSYEGIDAVADRLRNSTNGITDWAAGRQRVLDALAGIRAGILNGTFP